MKSDHARKGFAITALLLCALLMGPANAEGQQAMVGGRRALLGGGVAMGVAANQLDLLTKYLKKRTGSPPDDSAPAPGPTPSPTPTMYGPIITAIVNRKTGGGGVGN